MTDIVRTPEEVIAELERTNPDFAAQAAARATRKAQEARAEVERLTAEEEAAAERVRLIQARAVEFQASLEVPKMTFLAVVDLIPTRKFSTLNSLGEIKRDLWAAHVNLYRSVEAVATTAPERFEAENFARRVIHLHPSSRFMAFLAQLPND